MARPSMTINKIQSGDIVMCIERVHPMTVDKVYFNSRPGFEGELAECVWHDDTGAPHRQWYVTDTLSKLSELKRPTSPEVMQMKTEIMTSLIQAYGEVVRASDLIAEAEEIYKAIGLNP